VVVGTDAPIPQFGDRLLVEILYDTGACDACNREIGEAADPARWPISFGVVPPPSGATHVHAVLYRSIDTGDDGRPTGGAVIEAYAELPPATGPLRVPLVLSMACFGARAGDAHATCDPATGTLAPEPVLVAGDAGALPAPGSFPGAARVDCAGAPPPGMVCVPGGLFLMGYGRAFPVDAASLPAPEHAVQLPPFALDADEVTVGAARPYIAGLSPPLVVRDPDPSVDADACSFIGASTANDALPLNCVTYDQAAAICKAQGKRLPTEAEWEFAARGETAGSTYPWGEAADVCSRAIVGRGRTLFDVYPGSLDESSVCRTAGPEDALPWGLVPGGSPLDATPRGLRNLCGSVSEYVADAFSRYDEPCWTGSPVLSNPRCDAPGKDGRYVTTRGGAWNLPPLFAKMYERGNLAGSGAAVRSTGYDSGLGFRCARSM
jgi:sulfatase modifying factor 1